MKIPLKIFAAVLAYLLCFFAFFSMHTVSVSKIWDNYNIVYAEKSIPEETVVHALENSGCRNILYMGSQKIPVVKTILPVYKEPESSYMKDRLKYFQDEKGVYSVFYVPAEYERFTVEGVNSLAKAKLDVGMDFKQEYPWIVPVLCCLAFLGVFIFSSHKILFVLLGIIPLAIPFVLPLYPVCSAVVLLLLVLMLALRPWGRKNAFHMLINNAGFCILAIPVFPSFFMISTKAGLMALMAIGFMIFLAFIFARLQKDFDSLHSFTYEKILTARSFPVLYKRTAMGLCFSIVPLLAIFVVFEFVSRFMPANANSAIAVPVPVTQWEEDEVLPYSTDFYEWVWNKASAPYRNLYDPEPGKVQYGDRITQKRFEQTEDGIRQTEEVLMAFDETFFGKCRDIVNGFDYPSIEAFMEELGPDVRVKYRETVSAAGKNTDNMLSMKNSLVMIVCIIVPLIAVGTYMLFGKKKHEDSK